MTSTEELQQIDSLKRQLRTYEEELEWTKAQLDVANDVRHAFLSTMSHEIRTPMNGVLGMLGLLMDSKLSPEQHSQASTAQVCAEHLLLLLHSMLDFSNLESGNVQLEASDYELPSAVEEVIEQLLPRAQEKNLELTCWLAADLPTMVRGDFHRFQQILGNIVGNAIKFSDSGEIVVQVQATQQDDLDAKVRIDVIDQGIGLKESYQHRMFEPFTQADGSITRRHGGTGLGLAICRRLIELMGGKIGVEPRDEPGSHFWFELTLPRRDLQEAPKLANLEGVRALVVDDNATNRKILERQLSAYKMHPELAESGAEALDKLELAVLEGEPFQMIVLDMCMPQMDGLALAHEVNARCNGQPPPMVMLSSFVSTDHRESLERAGVLECLSKPARASRLMRVIASLVEREQARQSQSQRSLKRVLVADDNRTNQLVARKMMERVGYRADVVDNGLEAVEALSHRTYDLVLMDLEMPEMDGLEATRTIREKEEHIRTPIVALTAYALPEHRAQCMEAGMDGFLPKPLKSAELDHILRSLASKHGS